MLALDPEAFKETDSNQNFWLLECENSEKIKNKNKGISWSLLP